MNNARKCLVLFGPPLAGKGTLSRILISHFDACHIDMGNILRKQLAENAELSHKLSIGERLDNECVINMFKSEFELIDKNQNVILDGFPRTIEQAEYLADNVSSDEVYIIELVVPLQELLDRAKRRVICKECGVTGIQDTGECRCGACVWYKRSDDLGNIPYRRYNDYCSYRDAVLSFCERVGTIISMNGVLPAEVLGSSVIQKINGVSI